MNLNPQLVEKLEMNEMFVIKGGNAPREDGNLNCGGGTSCNGVC